MFLFSFFSAEILQGNYRERPQSTDSCTSVTRYVFAASQLAQEDGSPISIKKAMLRAYLQVAPRVLHDIRANVTIKARLFGSSSNMTTEGKKVGFIPDIDLTPGWMEMEIDANEIRSLFHRHSIQSDDRLEFLLYLQAAGCNIMRVPASFADPAGFRSPKKQQRSLGLQPFLLAFSDDEVSMTDLRLSKLDSEVSKSKRSVTHVDQHPSQTDICQRQQYIINFEDIGLDSILVPREADIGYCSGLCPNTYSQRAHLIRLAQSQDIGSGDTDGIPSEPAHCSPTAYQPLDILSIKKDQYSISIERLSDVIVESCRCTPTGPGIGSCN